MTYQQRKTLQEMIERVLYFANRNGDFLLMARAQSPLIQMEEHNVQG